jgi:hypothetical protein
MMSPRAIRSAWLGILVLAGCASSPEPVRVRVVTDANLVRTCKVIGTVADNEMEDLQKKAARLGGNTALLTPERETKGGYFGLQKYMTADVYQCDGAK